VKQLMCIRGVSGEKAIQLAKRFTSHAHFISQMDCQAGEAERVAMVMHVGQGISRRQVGKVLAKHILECLYDN
jgi:hypothetical protein